jgi:2-polyprenyl-3-methyl-5-hydroxy-6-metoxy-1,4-benzoquinol methylase
MEAPPSSRYATNAPLSKFSRDKIIVDMVSHNKDVLELGCSTGFVSQHFVKNGCKVTGVEIDEAAAQSARTFCWRVETIDINDPDWIRKVGGPFDIIVFGDVLEHLLDPIETLRLSRELLRDGGRVVISLPNIAHWTIRLGLLLGNFDYTSTGILDLTHLKFFTLRSASRMIKDAGFRIIGFQPIIGGSLSRFFGGFWQIGAQFLPGLFAFQLMFLVVPQSHSELPILNSH